MSIDDVNLSMLASSYDDDDDDDDGDGDDDKYADDSSDAAENALGLFCFPGGHTCSSVVAHLSKHLRSVFASIFGYTFAFPGDLPQMDVVAGINK